MKRRQTLFERMSRMARAVPTYASVGGPPDDWQRWDVYLDGEPFKNAIEVNTAEEWATVYKLDENGHPVTVGQGEAMRFATETQRGNFELRWRDAP